MTTGREALHRIDAAIAEARLGLKNASNAAAADGQSLATFDREEIDIFNELAAIRLAHLQETDGNHGALGSVDQRAEEMVADHDAFLIELESRRDKARREIESLEERRRETERAQEEAIERHDNAAAATRKRLENDPAYQDHADAVETANATAARAVQKRDLAEADRIEKGAPYEADPLFAYLRARNFATRDYKAFFLFELIDTWIARLIKYHRHKLNYDRLTELPLRLDDHAERLETLAARAEEKLEEMEREAMLRDGVDALRDEVNILTSRLEEIDTNIASAEQRHEETARDYAAVANGEKGPIAEARALLRSSLERLSIPELKMLAAETETREDDRLVDALIRVRVQRMELEEARKAAARSIRQQSTTLSELEDLRRKFKSRRFDSPYSEFTGHDLIGALIAEFLRGRVSRDDFWRRIERGHRTRRRDWDYDMGGDQWRDQFGLPDSWGGSWNGGRTRPGGIRNGGSPHRPRIPRAPRAPRVRFPSGGRGSRRGGGGFKTGGGF